MNKKTRIERNVPGTDGQSCDSNTVRCITCSRTSVKMHRLGPDGTEHFEM